MANRKYEVYAVRNGEFGNQLDISNNFLDSMRVARDAARNPNYYYGAKGAKVYVNDTTKHRTLMTDGKASANGIKVPHKLSNLQRMAQRGRAKINANTQSKGNSVG